MKKFNIVMSGLLLQAGLLIGQTYLEPAEGYRVADFLSDYTRIGAFDIKGDRVFLQDGDTIHVIHAHTGEEIGMYGEPADYKVANYASFVTVSPDEKSIWAGYTSDGNVDDRIYSIDMKSGEWSLKARFPGNYDLLFWKDSILVSGLNSASWGDPNGIFVLDTSGLDQHRLVVEVGGNSAGMALDTLNNLYYGTSYSMDPNAIYMWSRADLEAVIESPGSDTLHISDGVKLTDVPAGVTDCEIDAGFNLVFTMNLFGSQKVLARYKGTFGGGDGYMLDTLALANGEWDWLGSVKTMGDFTIPSIGERIVTFSFGKSLVDLHTANYPPVIRADLPVIFGYENASMDTLDLAEYVTDPDDVENFVFTILGLSDPEVADLQVRGDLLTGQLGNTGQANLLIYGVSGEHEFKLKTEVGTWPLIEDDHTISTMEDVILEPESSWNGSDGTGAFTSASARFHNAYNPEWFAWSGWASSNVRDNITPGWMNQYSAITGSGFDGSANYAVAYTPVPSVIDFTEDKAHAVKGFFVTNSSYAALSMEHGDDYAKKFGGAEGSDPDFFRLDIWGSRDGTATDTIGYYLADFRSENSFKDYILTTWQWVDVSSLGKVDSLQFFLSSSDVGDWGMNTPGYFCLDQLYVLPDGAPYVAQPLENVMMVCGGPDTILDLSTLFVDPDDPDDSIAVSVVYNSSEDILEASLSGKELRLRSQACLVKSTLVDVELVLEGQSGGLSARDTLLVQIEMFTGISGTEDQDIRIYPNPARESLRIFTPVPEVLEISLVSISGSVLYHNPEFEAGQILDLSSLPAGPYIVRIRGEKGIYNKLIQKL